MLRNSSTGVVSALLFSFFMMTTAAAAQDAAQPAPQDPAPPQLVNLEVVTPPATRPGILIPMYIGLAGLQAYDGYSTLYGVRNGAEETNPLVGGLAKQPAAFWSIKVLSTVVTIYYAERLWRDHHPKEAIVLMVVANGVFGAVAARNRAVR